MFYETSLIMMNDSSNIWTKYGDINMPLFLLIYQYFFPYTKFIIIIIIIIIIIKKHA